MNRIPYSLLICILAMLLLAAAAYAQSPSITEIDQQIDVLETSETVSPDDRMQALGALRAARTEIEQLGQLREDATEMARSAASQDAIRAELADQLSSAQGAIVLPGETAPAADLSSTLSVLEAERSATTARLNELRTRQTDFVSKSASIPGRLAAIAETETSLGDIDAVDGDNLLALAQSSLRRARRARLIQEKDTLSLDLETLSVRKEFLTTRILTAEARLNTLQAAIALLQARLAETRIGRADDAVAEATATLTELPADAESLRKLATQNLALAETRLTFAKSESDRERGLADFRTHSSEIQQSAETVQRILETGSLTDELGEVLRAVRTGLPKPVELNQQILSLEQAQVTLQLNQILWQERLRGLANPNDALNRLTEGSEMDDPARGWRETGLGLIESRKILLTGLVEDARREADQLATQEVAIRDLLLRAETLATLLDRRLLWLRTSDPLGPDWFTKLPSALGAMVSPESGSDVARSVRGLFSTKPFSVAMIVFISASLLLFDKWLHAQMTGLATRVGNVGRDTYWTTPLALTITLLVTVPIPLILFSAGSMLAETAASTQLVTAVSQALISTAFVVFILMMFREMARKRGLFDGHFGWSELAALRLRRALTWFTIIEGAATFVFTLASYGNDPVTRYSIGLVAFFVGAVAIVVFVWKLFKPTGSVFSELVAGNATSQRTLTLLFPALLFGPLINGLLPLRGYFDTAATMQSKVFQSGILLFVAAVIFGLLMRLYLVAQRRFALQKAREHRKKAEASRIAASDSEASGDAIPADMQDDEPDPDLLSAQMRNVLLSIAGLVLAFGLWGVWSPVVPALGVADEITLWQTTTLTEGVPVTRSVTLWNLMFCLILLLGGLLIARNIRGFLEVGLFQRMGLDAGTRYAAVTIAGYLIIMVGAVAGLAQLGVDWSRLQWVVAALGVGLGFGLQEIVANFISGLIILFERPVRVGDTVTIGELSGTVSSIRIRATTVTDWDNRDVILPNKTLITENVTNWTLNNSVTRLLLKIGVAYGSDINQVRSLIEDVLEQHPDVLDTPPPTVFFMRHGDSSLDFEARLFGLPTNKRASKSSEQSHTD